MSIRKAGKRTRPEPGLRVKKPINHKNTSGEKRSLLKKAGIFRELKDEELDIIAEYSEFRSFADDEVIFKSGTNGDMLYLIKRGMVRILAPHDGEMHDIAQFIEGELFGELDLFEEAPRSVDAVAETPTELLCFPRQGLKFEELLPRHPRIFAEILKILLGQIAVRIREANKLVSEKVPWIEDLRKQLFFDKLTGLYNKAFLEEDFKLQLAKTTACAVLAIKPDNFKTVNDESGHDAGDKTLRLLADMLKDYLDASGTGVRFRGDEYIAVFPECKAEGAHKHAQALLEKVKAIDMSSMVKQ
ncbi:MAG: GGDEF domain-containing protein, partial [Spirochaetaceae bacterium]